MNIEENIENVGTPKGKKKKKLLPLSLYLFCFSFFVLTSYYYKVGFFLPVNHLPFVILYHCLLLITFLTDNLNKIWMTLNFEPNYIQNLCFCMLKLTFIPKIIFILLYHFGT
jgi:hypothetical protein